MEIQQLRYFIAAAESGSISRAARRCSVAQPSISQQLKRLEQGLGVELFERHARGIALTDAGRALLPRARRIIADADEARDSLAPEMLDESPRLSIGAIPTMAPFILPLLVTALRREFPKGDFLIREDLTENLVDALVDHEIDVAIMSTPVDHPQIDLEVVGVEPMLVVVPTSHALAKSESVGVADLRDEQSVTLDEMHCLARQIESWCSSRRVSRSISCQTTQIATVVELVRQGAGISIVPRMAATSVPRKGLVFLPLKQTGAIREIAVARRVGRPVSLAGDRLRELLADQFER